MVPNLFLPNFGKFLKTNLAAQLEKLSWLWSGYEMAPNRAKVKELPAGLGQGMLIGQVRLG